MSLTFLCTAKLRNELGVKDKELVTPEIDTHNLNLWYADLIRIGHTKSLIFVHPETRYTLVALDRKKPEIKLIEQILKDVFTEILRIEGVGEDIIQKIAIDPENPLIAKTIDKSVIGTMTEMGRNLTFKFDYIEQVCSANEISVSRELNHIPICSLKGDSFPYRRMATLLKDNFGFKGEFAKEEWLLRSSLKSEALEKSESLPKEISNLNAERLWRSIPKNLQEKILANVWCGTCLTASQMFNWQLGQEGQFVTLKGQCAECGGDCVRVLD